MKWSFWEQWGRSNGRDRSLTVALSRLCKASAKVEGRFTVYAASDKRPSTFRQHHVLMAQGYGY